MALSIVILAAGQGTRMKSDLPKVLQPMAGRPLLAHVLDRCRELSADAVHVVYGHGVERVKQEFAGHSVNWVLQAEQLGTGHAVQQAAPHIPADHNVLVLCADVPLIKAGTLKQLLAELDRKPLSLLTVDMSDPSGYGRIIRGADGAVQAIVEHRDASVEQRAVKEINTGLLAARADKLAGWLDGLKADNDQQEYYLTDIVALAVAGGDSVAAVSCSSESEVLGINDKLQLAEAEAVYRRRQAEALMRAGVTLADPARLDVRGTLECGRDVFIDVNAVFEGRVVLGDRVRIGPNAFLKDVELGADTEVLANCVMEQVRAGKACNLGPFARLRPGAELADHVKVGNFVELKKSQIGKGSKVNHLTYVGDSLVGEGVNVGAGTVTCNYDGVNKYQTIIGDGAFIGSGVMLVAPVEVGAGAVLGAGSVITKPAPENKLTVARARQLVVPGWKRPEKKPKN
jgi:bifunctional UDP-N-acetylglucosamine pyrophosphorylase/glucosamine-1-phosphate N-acetyltransferase